MMSVSLDREYHNRREAQERDLAAKATDEVARKIHIELASQHATEKVRKKPKLQLFK